MPPCVFFVGGTTLYMPPYVPGRMPPYYTVYGSATPLGEGKRQLLPVHGPWAGCERGCAQR